MSITSNNQSTPTHHSQASLDAPRESAPSTISITDVDAVALLPTISLPTTPPIRARKRSRETTDQIPFPDSDSNSSVTSRSSRSGEDDSASPSKRQKRSKTEIPVSTPEPTCARGKQVRFHPATVDNSLWADLYEGKYAGEHERSPYRVSSPPPTWATIESSMMTAISPQTTAPSSPTRPYSSIMIMPSSLDITHSIIASASSSTRSGPSDVQSLLRRSVKGAKSRSQLSFQRAKELLRRNSWSNDFEFDADVEDDASSVVSCIDERESWKDCDDVSVPRLSPPPSQRIMAMDLPTAEANRLQAVMVAKRKSDAKVEPPSIYMRPCRSVIGDHDGLPAFRPMGEDPVSLHLDPPPMEEVEKCTLVLMNVLEKLSAVDYRTATQAIEVMTRYQAKCSYNAGYADGTRAQEPAKTAESDEPQS